MSKNKFLGFRAEFFDIFGLITFALLIIISYPRLTNNIPLQEWEIYFLFVVGIAGLIVDGIIVYKTFLREK